MRPLGYCEDCYSAAAQAAWFDTRRIGLFPNRLRIVANLDTIPADRTLFTYRVNRSGSLRLKVQWRNSDEGSHLGRRRADPRAGNDPIGEFSPFNTTNLE